MDDHGLSLRWRHNGRDSVSNHQPHDCLLNRLFRRRSKKTSKLRVTGLCVGNSPVPQMASNAENVSIWWRHHDHWDCQEIKRQIENNSMSTLATNKIFREDLTVRSVGGHDILRVVSSTSLCNLVILTEYNARASETNLSIFCETFIDEFQAGLYILFQHQVCNGIYTSFIDMHPFQVYMYMYPSGCNGLKVDNHDFVYGGGVDILTHNE